MQFLPRGRLRPRARPGPQQPGQPFALWLAQAGADLDPLHAAVDRQPLPRPHPVEPDLAKFGPAYLAGRSGTDAVGEAEMAGVVDQPAGGQRQALRPVGAQVAPDAHQQGNPEQEQHVEEDAEEGRCRGQLDPLPAPSERELLHHQEPDATGDEQGDEPAGGYPEEGKQAAPAGPGQLPLRVRQPGQAEAVGPRPLHDDPGLRRQGRDGGERGLPRPRRRTRVRLGLPGPGAEDPGQPAALRLAQATADLDHGLAPRDEQALPLPVAVQPDVSDRLSRDLRNGAPRPEGRGCPAGGMGEAVRREDKVLRLRRAEHPPEPARHHDDADEADDEPPGPGPEVAEDDAVVEDPQAPARAGAQCQPEQPGGGPALPVGGRLPAQHGPAQLVLAGLEAGVGRRGG